MKRKTQLLILLALLSIAFTHSDGFSQVKVIRGGQENPAIVIAKSTMYGALTGLLVGAALSLVLDEDTGDIFKWSFVGGTFGGLALGIIHVATRPQPTSAMLQFDSGGLARVRVPPPTMRLQSNEVAVKIPLASFSL